MISGLPPTLTGTTGASEVKNDKGALGKDDFMKLLIAQLQAQDPTNPMEAQDMSAQLAQFSTVEGITNINTNMEALLQTQTALNNNAALDLIGKTVDSAGNGITLVEGQSKSLSYSLPAAAQSVTVDIFDSAGIKVATLTPGQQQQGINSITWTGKDAEGDQLPAGSYTYSVNAFNEKGQALNVDTFSAGVVTEVTFENGISYALVNGTKIPAGEISRVGLN